MPNPERIDTGAADMTLTTSRLHPVIPLKTKKALRNAKPNNENGVPFRPPFYNLLTLPASLYRI